MKQVLSVVLMTTIFFGGGYWYYTALAGCDVPISYRIGEVDSRFGVSEDEVRNAISTAESVWEDGTDRNLFTYDPDGELVVNFVYDERQALTKEQKKYDTLLDTKQNVSDSVRLEYERLAAEYETVRQTYENRVDAYETKLNAYNREVAEWNGRGGAPKDVFARLDATQASLKTEERSLNELSTKLNTLVRKINAVGSQGNTLVTDYNELVEEYNDKFAEGNEFTQGDYKDSVINIYEYESEEELAIVLAHEMGHALGLEHVEGKESLMYHFMEEQVLENGLTLEDKSAFTASCGSKGSMADTLAYLERTLRELLNRYK